MHFLWFTVYIDYGAIAFDSASQFQLRKLDSYSISSTENQHRSNDRYIIGSLTSALRRDAITDTPNKIPSKICS